MKKAKIQNTHATDTARSRRRMQHGMTGVRYARGSGQVAQPRLAQSAHGGEEGRGAHSQVSQSEGQVACGDVATLNKYDLSRGASRCQSFLGARRCTCARTREREREGGRRGGAGDRREQTILTLSPLSCTTYTMHVLDGRSSSFCICRLLAYCV